MSSQSVWRSRWILGTAVVLLGIPAMADEESAPASFVDAITDGKASLAFRYRYEFVDQDSFDDDAHASTLRLRLNYATAEYQGWSGLVEFDYVGELWPKDFNSGQGTSSPGRGQYPVVADPDGSDLNQLYLQYASGNDWRGRLGRQRILLDDQRFVGGVGWRQNEQTYDALNFKYDGLDRTSISYSYVAAVNRIFGSSVPAGKHDHNTHLLNARVDLDENFKVIGYAYLIDNDDASPASTDTFGLRIEGGLDLGAGKLALLGEVATQSDAGDNAASFDTDYYRLQAIWKGGLWTAGLGYEVLGSDNGQGFRTPLATLHAFNGWADQFLGTPPDGLEDLYFRLGAKVAKWSFEGRYHDFGAEATSEDYAREIDLVAKRPLGERYDLLLKAAFFDAKSANFEDVTKFWLMLSARF